MQCDTKNILTKYLVIMKIISITPQEKRVGLPDYCLSFALASSKLLPIFEMQ